MRAQGQRGKGALVSDKTEQEEQTERGKGVWSGICISMQVCASCSAAAAVRRSVVKRERLSTTRSYKVGVPSGASGAVVSTTVISKMGWALGVR